MTNHSFWQLIEASLDFSKGEREQQLEFLQKELQKLSADEILNYCTYMMHLLKKACNPTFWICFFNMNGGYEEWGFEDFRYWLISKGELFWNHSLDNPIEFLYDNIHFNDGDNPDVTYYEFWSVFKIAYEEKKKSSLAQEMEWTKIYEEVQNCEMDLEKSMRTQYDIQNIKKMYPHFYEKFYQKYYHLIKLYHNRKKEVD
jgi:hypothetical protein